MNILIPTLITKNHIQREESIMTTYTDTNNKTDELLRLRREKRRERRRRQLSAFYKSVSDQNADKVIFLFDADMNIA